jgi:hypothetical protein
LEYPVARLRRAPPPIPQHSAYIVRDLRNRALSQPHSLRSDRRGPKKIKVKDIPLKGPPRKRYTSIILIDP